ncbi:carbonic anhydrase 4 [Nephila pilipes]|uniref:Carbonic anhydrase n=1 Tax=Nephila pilipes TaxID=299642 RepID=A0A8X6PB63_NEPPI|nr:carbonic anhydrase 4 [Nephila pilipes]
MINGDSPTSDRQARADWIKVFLSNSYCKAEEKQQWSYYGRTNAKIMLDDGVTRSIEVLGSTYDLKSLHFHWGSPNNAGSEHILDGIHYDCEAHFVHKNERNGVAVIAVLYEKNAGINKAFNPIVDALPEIVYKGKRVSLPSQLHLQQLLTQDSENFYHYNGSLTTPECDETVSWFILKGINYIGKTQMAPFYKLRTVTETESHENCNLVNNYRLTQELNGRIVFSPK